MTNSERQPILFDVYPDLKRRIGWIPLGLFPTSVDRLTHVGHDNLWIKRDDQTSPIYGGNKVRKLEFILGDVIKRGKSHVVSMGGIGTHHGLALAIFCQRLRLSCSLLLYEQPVTQAVRQNMRLLHKYNAGMVYVGSMLNAGIHFYLQERIRNRGAYFLYAGGSTPIGALGFVNAAFELREQIERGSAPRPDHIFCPLGTNGTMAGLSLGLLLAKLNCSVIGVRVIESCLGPLPLATPGTVKSLMKRTYKLLRTNSESIPDIEIHTPIVLDEYFGQGYGIPTEAGLKAVEFLRSREGIGLDLTYTGKTFAAILDFIQNSSRQDDTILYWHTYNSVDLSSQAKQVDHRNLPVDFHPFFH